MLEQIDSIAWASFPQPEWNTPTSVPNALRRLAACASDDEAQKACFDYQFAVGNGSAGTYFPVILPTLPFLGEILRAGGSRARQATLDILVDVTGSFAPDPRYQTVLAASGAAVLLRQRVRENAVELTDIIRTLALSPAPETAIRHLAVELLELLAEEQ